jgi:hypothetical protein
MRAPSPTAVTVRRRRLGRARHRRRLRGAAHVQGLRAAEARAAQGPHHSVAPAVKTEGYLHEFDLTTDWGPIEAEGRSMLLVRIHEVGALAELDEVSKSEVFLKAAGNSVLNVGKGVASAVKDPKATAAGDRRRHQALRDEPRAQGEAHGRQGRRRGRGRRRRRRPGQSRSPRPTRRPRRGRGRELGARGERRRAQVGAEGRRRPVHHEPDPQEGAHRPRPDRRRGRDRGQDRGADPDGGELHGDRRATWCGPRTPRRC